MSLRHLIACVLFMAVFAVELSSGTFCDEGPPGRYCFKNLSGWYECTLDSKTQKMTQKEHQCAASTRCQCFYGPSCPDALKDPCGPYELPPPFPEVFSTFYVHVVTTCDTQGCTNVTSLGEILQNATAKVQRHDRVDALWETQFVFPLNYIQKKDFFQLDTDWFAKNCSLTFPSTFPRLGVPSYFTCNKLQVEKKDNATFTVCLWHSGGHNPTEEVTTETWLLLPTPDGRYVPIEHVIHVLSTPVSKSQMTYETAYQGFFPDVLDPNQMMAPNFCPNNSGAFFE